MSSYKRILVAVDFSSVAEKLLERAKPIAAVSGARLQLVHVVEYFPPVDPSGDLSISPVWEVDETQLMALAEQKLAELVKTADLGDSPREVLLGNAKHEITAYAGEQQCDLIVVGSHGRHGIGRLLGSTATAVLHRAACDVLAVRAPE